MKKALALAKSSLFKFVNFVGVSKSIDVKAPVSSFECTTATIECLQKVRFAIPWRDARVGYSDN